MRELKKNQFCLVFPQLLTMDKITLAWLIYTVLIISFPSIYGTEPSNKCPGPLEYYESLECKPLCNFGDKCPYKYDCDADALKSRSTNKCYVNGKVYNTGKR